MNKKHLGCAAFCFLSFSLGCAVIAAVDNSMLGTDTAKAKQIIIEQQCGQHDPITGDFVISNQRN